MRKLLTLSLMIAAGCTPFKPVERTYALHIAGANTGYTVHIADMEKVNREYKKVCPVKPWCYDRVDGFINYAGAEIWSIDDPKIIAHEKRHAREGQWHPRREELLKKGGQ